jgi:hypothetical protein
MNPLSQLIKGIWYTLDSIHRLPGRLLLLALLLFTVSVDVLAQDSKQQEREDPARQVHWAMGAYFGAGWYKVDASRTVYILRVKPGKTLLESSIDANGKRAPGIELQFPLSFGVQKREALDDFFDFDNYATVSFTPGIQVEIPVTEKWYLRPYVNVGWGTETTTTDSAWIYYGGIKSRYQLGSGKNNWSLLNAIHFAGYNPDFGNRGKYGSFMTGLEFDHPLKGLSLGVMISG